MNAFDILLLALILLNAWHGWQKGLLTGFFKFIGIIAGFVIAAKEHRAFLAWLETWLPVRQWLEPKIYDWSLPLVRSKIGAVEHQTLNDILSFLPPSLRDRLSLGLLPNLEALAEQAAANVARDLSGMITEHLLRILAFVLLLFIVLIVVRLGTALVLAPFGGQEGLLNRLGGALFGGLSTFILFSVLIGMATPFLDVFNPDFTLRNVIHGASLYPYLLQVFEFLNGVLWQNGGTELLEPLKSLERLRI